jgi:YVTN family beta-propeller protein
LLVSGDGRRVFVADQNSDDVRVIDTQTMQVVGEPIKTGDSPAQIALSPDGRRIYVANMYSDDVSVIDTDTLATVATSGKVGSTPRGIAVAAT